MSNLEGAEMAQEHEQNDPSLQEWVTMAQAWIDSFPQATEVTMSEVEAWVDSNLSSLPEGLRSVPRPDIYLRLIITSNRLRLERSRCENHVSRLAYSVHEEREVNQPGLRHAQFQRTDQWIPAYSWLETLDKDEVVDSKEIADWLAENPKVQEKLYSRHSRHHVMRYIKKCHLKILKRRAKSKGLEQPDKDTSMKVPNDVVIKHSAPLPSSSANSLSNDSDLYLAKRNEAYRKYELLVELEKLLSPVFSKHPKTTNETVSKQ